jgi:transposase InsO family protein
MFKLLGTSVGGRTGVKKIGPVQIVGKDNVTSMIVEGRVVRCLLDTGSMVTTISETYYRKHLADRCELLELDCIIKLEGAGGNELPYSGFVEVGFCVPGSDDELTVPVLVVPATRYNADVPIIVGTNVLDILKKRGFSSKSHAWRLAMQHYVEHDDVAVYTTSAKEIAPNCSVVICARVGAQRPYKAGILEPVDLLPGGVVMPVSVVRLQENQTVYVRLMNLSSHNVRIPKRQRIATLSCAKLLDDRPGIKVSQHQVVVEKSKGDEDTVERAAVNVDLSQTDLDEMQKAEVAQLMERCNGVFAADSIELGNAVGVKHRIRLTDDTPFKDKPRRIPPAMYDELKKHIQEMLAAGAIRHSTSPWASNVVLVRKKDGRLRVCIDYRKLNARTIRDAYSIPLIDATLDSLSGAKWFTTLDLQAGYWQIQLAEEDKEKTAFTVGNLGFFEAERMPFGLTNAPATFQRLMEQTLADLTNTMAYLDDVIIHSKTFEEHLERLEAVFNKLQEKGLKLKPSKCHLFRKRVEYLGHVISERGIEADPGKVEVVREWPVPKTVQDLRQALGFFGYYRRFVQDYAKIAKPLHELLQGQENTKHANKKTEVKLSQDAGTAFHTLKNKLITLPILAYADFTLPFELHTDASGLGLGAVLYQTQDGVKRVIAYASRGLRNSEQHYSAHKLEFLALKWSVTEKFKDYLYGTHFRVFTDNNPLCYVLSTAKLDACGHRWLAELSTFDFDIQYRSGKKNGDADALSRRTDHIRAEVVAAMCAGTAERSEVVLDSDEVVAHQRAMKASTAVLEQNRLKWIRDQEKDQVISKITAALKKGKPSARELAQLNQQWPEVKLYLRTWNRLVLRDGVLYRSREVDGATTYQLVLPASSREMALKGLHDDVGHLGRDRTLELVRSRFFWPRMSEEVSTYVKRCLPCIKRKAHIPDRAPMVPITTTQPLELLCIDFLTLEPSKGGVENVLVMTDHFTRYAHAVPTRNQTAKTTAQVLSGFFMHYGFPLRLHSDQGRNFESAVIRELCELMGTVKSRTTPYHPMGNGLCERFNSTLMNMLGTLEDKQKANWKAYVPGLVHAYNCTQHDSTGYSPFYLMFGRHPRLPIDIIMGLELEDRETEPTSKYVEEVKEKLEFAYDAAMQKSALASGAQKLRYDKRVKGASVQVGDRVLVKNVGLRGKHKLANKYEDGVYLVKEQPNQDVPVYVVQPEQGTKKRRILHRNLLLPVNFLPLKPVPLPRRRVEARDEPVRDREENVDRGSEDGDNGVTDGDSDVEADKENAVNGDNEGMGGDDRGRGRDDATDTDDDTDEESDEESDDESDDVSGESSSDDTEAAVPVPVPRPRRNRREPDRFQGDNFRR